MKRSCKVNAQDKPAASVPPRTEALIRALLPFGVKWVTTGDKPDSELQMWSSEPVRDGRYNIYYCPTGRYLGTIFAGGLGLRPFAKISVMNPQNGK